MNLDLILLIAVGLLALSVAANMVAVRLGVPAVLTFLAIGMLAGSDGPGGIWFSDHQLAQDIGVIALAFILFSGGMDTDWPVVRAFYRRAGSLATVGVAVTAGVVGLLCHRFIGFTLLEGLLLGGIIASTDAATVFATLRGKGVKLRQDLRATLELESGSNDPMAIFLTAWLVSIVQGKAGFGAGMVWDFAVQMVLGAVGGFLVGRAGVLTMRKLVVEPEALYHVVSIAVVLASYSLVSVAGGNGFLAVYVAGIAFGNGQFRQRKGLRRFHDGMAWMFQIAMFLMLGLLVFPSELPGVVGKGLLVAAVLVFVARPIGVFLSLLPFRIPAREQVLIAWTGLRGAVPIILATFPLLAGVERSREIFTMVFFVVFISALLQGTTLPWVARKLGLEEPVPGAEPSAPPTT